MKKLFKLLKLSVVVLTVISLAVSALDGIVLCSGADGHFKFELAEHDCCGDEAAADSHSPVAGMNAGNVGDCAVCIDVVLSPGRARISVSGESFKYQPSAAGCLPYIFALINRSIDAGDSSHRKPSFSATLSRNKTSLTALRSVVLRV